MSSLIRSSGVVADDDDKVSLEDRPGAVCREDRGDGADVIELEGFLLLTVNVDASSGTSNATTSSFDLDRCEGREDRCCFPPSFDLDPPNDDRIIIRSSLDLDRDDDD